VFKYF
jgi:hypothetical protein